MTPAPELVRTRRLLLTRPEERDRDGFLALYRDPRVMATLGGPLSDAEIHARFDGFRGEWAERGLGFWTARDAATGAYVGRGGLRHVVLDGVEEVEVGYALRAERWGEGLATELARASLRVGFEALALERIVAFTLPANAASRRVMERAGMRLERAGERHGMPHVFYGIAAAEWRAGPAPAR